MLRIHELQLERFGGTTGLRDDGGLESALARPQSTFGGEDLYPSLSGKAAVLFHSLASNHPFIDGNKRTAVMAAEIFLRVNGYTLSASDDDLEDLTMRVAKGELDGERIGVWLDQRLVEMR